MYIAWCLSIGGYAIFRHRAAPVSLHGGPWRRRRNVPASINMASPPPEAAVAEHRLARVARGAQALQVGRIVVAAGGAGHDVVHLLGDRRATVRGVMSERIGAPDALAQEQQAQPSPTSSVGASRSRVASRSVRRRVRDPRSQIIWGITLVAVGARKSLMRIGCGKTSPSSSRLNSASRDILKIGLPAGSFLKSSRR